MKQGKLSDRPGRGFVPEARRRLADLDRQVAALTQEVRAAVGALNPQWKGRRGGLVRGPWLCQVVDEAGEEATYTDERYWVTSAYASNSSGTHDADMTFGLQSGVIQIHVTATNLAEMGEATHDVPTGAKVLVCMVTDMQGPPVPHYFFYWAGSAATLELSGVAPPAIAAAGAAGSGEAAAIGGEEGHTHAGLTNIRALAAGTPRLGPIVVTHNVANDYIGVSDITGGGDATLQIDFLSGHCYRVDVNSISRPADPDPLHWELGLYSGSGVNIYWDGATTNAEFALGGLTADWDVQGGGAFTITGIPTPAADTEVANKKYVDDNVVSDHGGLGGLGDDDHPQYGALAQNETVAGEWTFGIFPITPSAAPDADYEVANKKYVDDNAGVSDHGALTGLLDDDHTQYAALAQNETVAGEWTFGIFPITPSAAPDADYEVANKKYVDDNAGVTDHGALTGLGDDDHTQYTLVTGTRAFANVDTDGDLLYWNQGVGYEAIAIPGDAGDFFLKCTVNGAYAYTWIEASGQLGLFVPSPGGFTTDAVLHPNGAGGAEWVEPP